MWGETVDTPAEEVVFSKEVARLHDRGCEQLAVLRSHVSYEVIGAR